jgi:hypothetical protein
MGNWRTSAFPCDDEFLTSLPDADRPRSAGVTGMSKESQELRDLLYQNGQIREFLERVARGSTQAERGGFILRGVNGNESPLYKIVEEVSNTPEPDSIDLYAWPAQPGGNWAGALFPACPPFGTLALANLPARLSADPHYRVRFWWHTHLTGLLTDPASRMHITGPSRPWGDDLKDKGVVGLMVQYDGFPERFQSFLIERNGKWFPLSPALFSGSVLRAANFDPEQARDEKGQWTTEKDQRPGSRRTVRAVCPNGGAPPRGPESEFKDADEAALDWAKLYAEDSINLDMEMASAIYQLPNGKVTYNVPNASEPGVPGVNIAPPPAGTKLRGYVHSHGQFTNNSDTFSDGPGSDITWADDHKVDGYLATPNGRLKKYVYSETDPGKKIKTLFKGLPYDPYDKTFPQH